MNRIDILTSVGYWEEALESKQDNNVSNKDFAKDIVDKMKELKILLSK